MSEADERQTRIAYHEASHAVLHFALGRPVEYVLAESTAHETKPVDGTALEPHLEAILWVCGLSAEEEWLRSVGREDDALAWLPSSGARGDYQIVARLYSDEEIGDAESEADELVRRYWTAISAVANRLLGTVRLDQAALAEIVETLGVSFGEAAARLSGAAQPESMN